jgi:hypothetical protein
MLIRTPASLRTLRGLTIDRPDHVQDRPAGPVHDGDEIEEATSQDASSRSKLVGRELIVHRRMACRSPLRRRKPSSITAGGISAMRQKQTFLVCRAGFARSESPALIQPGPCLLSSSLSNKSSLEVREQGCPEGIAADRTDHGGSGARQAASTAWLPPLPPGFRLQASPVTVSPRRGRWSTRPPACPP